MSSPLDDARSYHKANRDRLGLPEWKEGPSRLTADQDAGRLAGLAYHLLPHSPHDPETKAAYDALKAETLEQYKHAVSRGMAFLPWTQAGQPYKNSADMVKDVHDNRRLYYFPTDSGFGGEEGKADHPLMEPVPGLPGTRYNDLFRAVHDYYAHASHGHQFGPTGELRAWEEHARMYSPLARKALTTETHGQNSWVNFGPHEPWKKPMTERPYAEQKAGILGVEPAKLSRIHQDFQQYTRAIRPRLHQTKIKPNSPEEHGLMSEYLKNRGLKVTQSPVTFYDSDAHEFYHPEADKPSSWVPDYAKWSEKPVRLGRGGWRGNTYGYWIDPTGKVHDVGDRLMHEEYLTKNRLFHNQEDAYQAGWQKVNVIGQSKGSVLASGAKRLSRVQADALALLAIKHGAESAQHLTRGDIEPKRVKLARERLPGPGAANRAEQTDTHTTRLSIVKKILHEAGVKAAVRSVQAYSDARGLRPSVAAVSREALNPALAKYVGAWLGLMTGERRMTVFHPGEGEDTLHVIDSPHPVDHVAEYLRRSGVPSFSVEPRAGGTRAYVTDPMKTVNGPAIASGLHATAHTPIPGSSTLLGDPSSDSSARANYRDAIHSAEEEPTRLARIDPNPSAIVKVPIPTPVESPPKPTPTWFLPH